MIYWQNQKQYLYVIIADMSQLNGFGKCPACNEWNTFFEQKLVDKEVAKKEKRSFIC